jgi:apolipoprotein N-acyltransferase
MTAQPQVEMVASEATAPSPPIQSATAGFSPFLLAVVGAFGLWLAFPPVGRGDLAWIALVPLFALVESARPRWQVYLAGWLGGLVFWHLAIFWVTRAAPEAWAGWTVMATYLSVGWLIVLVIARWGVVGLGWPVALVLPVAWLVEEYYRAFTLTGFPWYYLAHTQWRHPLLIQIADLTGAWGVSLLVALVNGAIYDLAIQFVQQHRGARDVWSRPTILRFSTIGFLLLGTLAYGAWRTATARFEPGPRLALLQSDIPQDLKMSEDPNAVLELYAHLIQKALDRRPDLIVWPETSYPRGYPFIAPALPPDVLDRQAKILNPAGTGPFWRRKEALVRLELLDATDRLGVPMLVGTLAYDFRPSGVRRFNSAILLEPGKGATARYDKRHRVPFGEYIPGLETFPWLAKLTPFEPEEVPRLDAGDAPQLFDWQGLRLATAICFEDSVPQVVRQSFAQPGPGRHDPDILLNLSNDGWFRGTSELEMHLAASVFRAVENRVPLARAVNTGQTSIVDGNGRVVVALGNNTADVLVEPIPLDPRRSLYSSCGDWLPQLALAAGLLSVVIPLLARKSRLKSTQIAQGS